MAKVISNAGEKVKLTLTSRSPRVPNGRQGEFLPILVRVEAPPTVKQHVPVDVVALLNVSGSMNMGAAPGANTPSRMDLLKKAMKFVIKHLHEDDGLAIVPFNEKIVTSHSTDMFRISGQRVVAQNKVDKLMAKGDTSFSPALEQAVKILDERTEKNRLGVIMLLTDGLDNRKIAMYPIRADLLKKYPVHTFGICTHEPTVLLSIAQQSGGTYSFIDDKELGKITDAFAVFLGGLSSIVATNVLITLHSYTGPSWKSELKRIGCGFESSEITQPSRISNGYTTGYIRIGLLYAGEVKNFIVDFQVEPDASGTRAYGQILVTYNDTPGGPSINGDGHGVQPQTGKQAGDPEENSRMVREQIVQFNVVDFLSTLHAEFRKQKNIAGGKGDKEAMDAQIRAGSTLETKWAEFMDMMDDDLKDGLDLDDLQNEVTEMVSRLKRGAGMAYMCSWVSTQQMQRATTLGSVDTVGTQFFTPIMDDMIRESQKYHVLLPQGSSAPGGGPATTTTTTAPLGLVAQKKLDWSNLKLQAQAILGQPQDNDLIRLRDEMMVAIDKAMKQDIYLAAVGP
ncbi:hypothetical protein D1007_52292 [Hordeum vulgare]|nr:hypothetical protein D1007_52292 [Hordeum vulgare]